MRIHLIQPRSPRRYSRGSRDGYNGPLGLASIATVVQQHNPAAEVRVIDLEIEDVPEDVTTGADVVGITLTAFTVDPAVELARSAKRAGSTVVWGGIHASLCADSLLRRFDCVDAICVGQGEWAMLDVSNGVPLDAATNLVTRGTDPRRRRRRHECRDRMPLIGRHHLPMSAYFDAFTALKRTHCPSLPFRRPAAIFSQTGCAFRDRTGGCLFCSRQRGRLDLRDPATLWAEIGELESLDADLIWDFSDSFPSDPDWVRTLARCRPSGLRSRFYLYARADELDDEMLDTLAELGVVQILMGVETGDPALKAHKHTSLDQDLAAVAGMQRRGITVFPSYCLGLEGETRTSVNRTVEFAKRIAAAGQPFEVACSVLIPFVGTAAFQKLARRRPNIAALDPAALTPEFLQRSWVETFSEAPWEMFLEGMHEILRTAPLKSSFGVPTMSERAPYCDPATLDQFTCDHRRTVAEVR